jgi:hypothetical protein
MLPGFVIETAIQPIIIAEYSTVYYSFVLQFFTKIGLQTIHGKRVPYFTPIMQFASHPFVNKLGGIRIIFLDLLWSFVKILLI